MEDLQKLLGRFTPTCVGTMLKAIPRAIIELVHPHLRGDNAGSAGGAEICHGSPPLAWGQLYRRKFFMMDFRFTPTCVGTILHFLASLVIRLIRTIVVYNSQK